MAQRRGLIGGARHAAQHPERARRYLHRVRRDLTLRLRHRDHIAYDSPLSVIEECFAHVGRIMKPDGSFYFTFNRTEGKEYDRLREDFYYRTDTLIAAAERHGLKAQFMDDWERLQHIQSTIRVTRG